MGFVMDDEQRDLMTRAMPVLKTRAANLDEIADGAQFLFRTRPLDMDEAAAKLLEGDAPALLGKVHQALDALGNWDSQSLEAAVRGVADGAGAKLGMVAQPLRAALVGRKTSPGIFDVLLLLGREESLGRIADQAA